MRASSVKSRDVENVAEVRPMNPMWNPRLELDVTASPLNSSIREFQRGNAHYIEEALEQPLLLPKDMAALKHVKQQELFLSPKRDLALVSLSTHLANFMLGQLFLV